MTKRSTDFSEQSWWGMQNLEWFASTKVRTDYFSIESALIVFSTTSADGEYIRFAVLSSSWNCEEIVEERATLGCAKKSSRELEDSLITRRFQAHLYRSRIRNWDAFHFKKSSSPQSLSAERRWYVNCHRLLNHCFYNGFSGWRIWSLCPWSLQQEPRPISERSSAYLVRNFHLTLLFIWKNNSLQIITSFTDDFCAQRPLPESNSILLTSTACSEEAFVTAPQTNVRNCDAPWYKILPFLSSNVREYILK